MANPLQIASTRRADIDWLRVLVVSLLIPYHTARVFDFFEPNYAKNWELSWPLSYFIAAVGEWFMPLLFVLAGASTCLALRLRSGGQYLRERSLRLLVPFVFGLLVLAPPQSYYARLTLHQNPETYLRFYQPVPQSVQERVERMSQDPGPFWQWYPHFFAVEPDDLSGYAGTTTPAQLWFILYLFVFSLVALPLFLWLREKGKRVLSALAAFFSRPGTIFLLAFPLFLAEALPDLGGKNPFIFLLLFIYGFLLLADERFSAALDRQKWVALALALCALAAMFFGWFVLDIGQYADDSWQNILFALLRNLHIWFWVLALLGLGQRYLRRAGPVLRYASEASYPCYLLHQTIIVILGYYMVQLPASVAAKYLAIAAGTLAGTLGLYELIRRLRVTRFLFGMRVKPRRASP